MIVEQIRQRLRTELKETSQLNVNARDGFDDGSFEDGMEQILQIFIFDLHLESSNSGDKLSDRIQLARKTNLAIIAQG
jgi:hypothetical protein